jgi:hypothetical protein
MQGRATPVDLDPPIRALSSCACGGSDGNDMLTQDEIGTLPMSTRGAESGGQFRLFQSLRILHGDEELTVVELEFPPVAGIGLDLELGRNRNGKIFLLVSALQQLGVSPDGERVVFEVTDDFSATNTHSLAPEAEGIFSVDADGSGLRRIASASRYSNFNISSADPVYRFSTDGRTIGFTDLGPGPDGEDVPQIVLLDLASGVRTQVTHLPRSDYMAGPEFFTDGRLGFLATGIGENIYYTAPDGSGHLPALRDLPGGVFRFQITGQRPNCCHPDRAPVNTTDFGIVRKSRLTAPARQVNFNREDTARFGTTRALTASVSSSRLRSTWAKIRGDLPAALGQFARWRHPAAHAFLQDRRSPWGGALVTDAQDGLELCQRRHRRAHWMFILDSTCDPFGTTPYGEQIYDIRPDGTGLRQLTHTQGFIRGPDRSGTTELPGPWAYGPHL